MSRRERILSAAEQLFVHYGVSKTTIGEIARAAEIGVGTVYLEFNSKEAIVEALVVERHNMILATVREVVSSARNAEERLRSFLEARYQLFVEEAEKGAHASELVHGPQECTRAAWKIFEEREFSLLIDILEDGVRTGELDVPQPEVTAKALYRIHASFAPPHVFEQGGCRMQVLREVHQIILYGLVARR